MSTVRNKIRSGWIPVSIKFNDKFTHGDLYKWARDYFNSRDFGSTLVHRPDRSTESLFAFKHEQDASYFIMKWK